jgi:hypothetical protein
VDDSVKLYNKNNEESPKWKGVVPTLVPERDVILSLATLLTYQTRVSMGRCISGGANVTLDAKLRGHR